MEFRKDLIDKINALQVPNEFKNYDCGVIPLRGGVILQKVKSGERKTSSGILLVEKTESNEPVGRIVALGPEVAPYLKLGLLVTYHYAANMETYINGERMIFVDQSSVFHIVTEEKFYPKIAPESAEQKRRREKIERQEATLKRVYAKELNDEDEYEESVKKRTKKAPKKTSKSTSKK